MYKEKFIHSPWVIGILFGLWFLIIPPIVGVVLISKRNKHLREHQILWEKNKFAEINNSKEQILQLNEELKLLSKEKENIYKEIEEYKPITDKLKLINILDQKNKDLQENADSLNKNIQDKKMLINLEESRNAVNNEINNLNTQKVTILDDIYKLRQQMISLHDELEVQSFGFYKPKYGFENSEGYQNKLNEIRQDQKKMVKNKDATFHSLDWTISNDKKKGKEFILDTIKLLLRAFNNECDNIITKVKFSNVEASEQRIKKVHEELNKLTDMQQVFITPGYLNLKIEELYLKYEFEKKKQEEKEEQMEIKERMREEAKALKELEKAKEKVEKEEKHFEQAIEKLKSQMEETDSSKHAKLIEKLKELELQLAETKKNKEDVLFRVQNTRAGYVYIISNIGSFGENVYKIGMTRRLEPLDRVKELGDASVPFAFDVHGMIFSEDAPALENALHKAFTDRRVNKINERKEFFRVELSEIETIVKLNHNKTVEFTKIAKAEDYKQSIVLKEKELLVVS